MKRGIWECELCRLGTRAKIGLSGGMEPDHDACTLAQIARLIESAGVAKARLPLGRMVVPTILAGAFGRQHVFDTVGNSRRCAGDVGVGSGQSVVGYAGQSGSQGGRCRAGLSPCRSGGDGVE